MYFQHFPKLLYDIDGNGERIVPDLTAYTHIQSRLLDDVTYYRFYDINDGDRPDNVSMQLYGSSKYYWTFFIINEHLNNVYDDWPKGSRYFDAWLRKKYSNIAAVVNPRSSYLPENTIEGKFEIGELCTGQLSGSAGRIVAKYPTLGYVEIEPIYTSASHRDPASHFTSAGESIFGSSSQDSISADSIVPMYNAPHHHVYTHHENSDMIGRTTAMPHIVNTRPVSILEHESTREIENSRIRVIKKELIESAAREFRREMTRQA